MPSTIGKWKLFRTKHITILEGDKFLRNKHEIAFFEIKCTFFGRKENTINCLWLCLCFLEGETFLRNKHEIAFFEIKCTFFGRKENTISVREKRYFAIQAVIKMNAFNILQLIFLNMGQKTIHNNFVLDFQLEKNEKPCREYLVQLYLLISTSFTYTVSIN